MVNNNEVSTPLGALIVLEGCDSSANRYRSEMVREMTPILTELLSLGPGNDSHPVVLELSNWLQDPQRTGEQFTYVIGDLANEIMHEHGEGDCMYLVKAAAEALTVRCPVLKGSWEEAAWLLLFLGLIFHILCVFTCKKCHNIYTFVQVYSQGTLVFCIYIVFILSNKY